MKNVSLIAANKGWHLLSTNILLAARSLDHYPKIILVAGRHFTFEWGVGMAMGEVFVETVEFVPYMLPPGENGEPSPQTQKVLEVMRSFAESLEKPVM